MFPISCARRFWTGAHLKLPKWLGIWWDGSGLLVVGYPGSTCYRHDDSASSLRIWQDPLEWFLQASVVLAIGARNLPAVWVRTTQTGPVLFQTAPKPWPTASWWAKPGPIPINPHVLLGVTRPIGSNHWFRLLGFSVDSRTPICYCSLQHIDYGKSFSFFDALPAFIFKKQRYTLPTQSWKWESTARQQFFVLHLQ